MSDSEFNEPKKPEKQKRVLTEKQIANLESMRDKKKKLNDARKLLSSREPEKLEKPVEKSRDDSESLREEIRTLKELMQQKNNPVYEEPPQYEYSYPTYNFIRRR